MGNSNTSDIKNLNTLDVWAMAFGCMVGWGAFVMPGTTFLPVAGPMGTVIAMIVGALIMLVIGYNFAFLMNRNPGTGGVYSYTKEAFGRDHAFLSSWFLCLSYLTIVFLNGTALFVVLKTMFGDMLHTNLSYTVSGNTIYLGEIIISVIALTGTGLMFILAGSVLRKIQTILAIVMITGIVILTVFCIPHISSVETFTAFGSQNVNAAYGIFSIVFLAPWAFVGFDVIAFDTSQFSFSVKKSKSIMFIAIIIAGFAYIAMALVGVSSVPDGYSGWSEYIPAIDSLGGLEAVPTFYAAEAILGKAGLILIGITALAAVLTGIIGGYRAIIRVLNTMAEDRILSETFSKQNYSILFIMLFSISLALLGRNTLNWFVDLTSFGAIAGFGYTSAAAYKLGRAENNRIVQRTGMTGTVISVLFVVVQLIPRLTVMEAMGSEAFLLLSIWCLLGFVFYWRTVTRGMLTEYSGMSLSGVVLFALLVYSAFMWIAKLIISKEDISEVHSVIVFDGMILMVFVFIGLIIMIYVQNLVRKKHEVSERDKIRAVEGNLAKSRFLFNMSHDIRTPMNAIMGYTALALKEPASDTLHDYLLKIDRSNRQMLTLINDILEMSRIESGDIALEYKPVDLCLMFDGIRELFEEQMKQKKIDFNVYSSHVKDRLVWCDEKNLNRVIVNLLSNAYKFTPEGGIVTASVSEPGNAEDGYGLYEIRIRDNGIGMSEDFVEKMFSPFERERTSTASGLEGTGLGLSISKRIMDMMDGTIDVLTAPGNGTEMLLRLKFKLAEESEIRETEEALQDEDDKNEVDFSDKRLLLVEDNMINMEIAKTILVQSGFKVETAENGQIAVDMVSSSTPGYYDAILMNIQMPVMDGYTATERIRDLNDIALSEIPILAMTANALKEDKEAALSAGMQAHIAKPVEVDELLRTLREVLRS